MANREMALCLALSGLAATAAAQTAPAPETWTLISHTAQAITGRVTFTPTEITFQNGQSLPLARRWPDALQARAEGKKGHG